MVGTALGPAVVGEAVGPGVGFAVGLAVEGVAVGSAEGLAVGLALGATVNCFWQPQPLRAVQSLSSQNPAVVITVPQSWLLVLVPSFGSPEFQLRYVLEHPGSHTKLPSTLMSFRPIQTPLEAVAVAALVRIKLFSAALLTQNISAPLSEHKSLQLSQVRSVVSNR
jgi:hypothetical protein